MTTKSISPTIKKKQQRDENRSAFGSSRFSGKNQTSRTNSWRYTDLLVCINNKDVATKMSVLVKGWWKGNAKRTKDVELVVIEHLLHLTNQMKIVEKMNMEILSNGYNEPKESINWLEAAALLKNEVCDVFTEQQNTKYVSLRNKELKHMCEKINSCMKDCPLEDTNNQPIAFMASMHRIEDGTLSHSKLEQTAKKETVSSEMIMTSGSRVGDGSKKVPSSDYCGAQVPNSTSEDEKKFKSEITEWDDDAQEQQQNTWQSDPNDEFAFSGEGGLPTKKNPPELGPIIPISITGVMSKYTNLRVEVSSSSNSQETSNLNSLFGLDPNKEKYLFSELELEKQRSASSLPEHLVVMSKTGTLKADEWHDAVVVNLIEKNNLSLFEEPNCPNLVLLFLQRNNQLTRIPPRYFNQMPALRFLDFSDTRIRALPSSLFKLSNLEVLMLRSCVCLERLPDEVKNLTKMKVLDLSGTDLYDVPEELGEVKGLRLLHLQLYQPDYGSGYARLPLMLIPSGTINTLQALESLSIVVHPEDQRWKDIVGDIIKHVGTLEKLSYLHFYFPTVEALQTFTEMSPSWKDQILRRFNFIVGDDIKRIISRVPSGVESKYSQYEKCLRLVNGNEVGKVMKTTLKRATAFYLDYHLEATSFSDFGISNFKEIKFCVVRECPKLEFIITRDRESSESAFPNLEYLGLHYLWELKQIWKDPVPSGSFKALKYLMVANCRKLEYIASHSILKCLSSLKTFNIEDCESLKSIVEDNERVKRGDEDDALLPRLTELVLRHLPQLVALGRGILFKGKINAEYCPKFRPKA